MRIAIQNPFSEPFFAETELSRRIYQAAIHLGWEAVEVQTAADINAVQPDFVIALHNNSPKLTEYPTYGCMWNPPSFFQGTQKYVKHVLSYDGYLTSSTVIERWLHHLLYTTPKPCLTAPFYTSCPQNSYHPPDLEQPTLVYFGSNWDGSRFHELFEGLDGQDYMQVYGKPDGWKHLKHSYQSALPYDGISVLKTLNQAGVGLCLHREEHRQAALPSMRIFEIVAAGAVAICGNHPFIRDAFDDTVLYVDTSLEIAEQLEQISAHMVWIQQHQSTALAMSEAAHQIFLNHYTLEKLLLGILPLHKTVIQEKGFIFPANPDSERSLVENLVENDYFNSSDSNSAGRGIDLQLIICMVGWQPSEIQQVLNIIVRQTFQNLGLIIIKTTEQRIDEFLSPYRNQIAIDILEGVPNEMQSTLVWKGLNAVQADYFAVLPPQTRLYPNHLSSLLSLLKHRRDIGVAYSGGLSISHPNVSLEDAPAPQPIVELEYFHGFDLEQLLRFEACVPPGGFVARRSLLDPILKTDPQLNAHVELCLLLQFAQRTSFAFSYDVTCEVQSVKSVSDQSRLQESRDWDSELARLKFIFWHQEFAPGKSLQTVQQAYFEQQHLKARIEDYRSQIQALTSQLQTELQTERATIAAMQTSKFWKLRTAWFKLKRAIGLSTDNE